MITTEFLIENKERVDEIARQLSSDDIDTLVSLLNEKNDEIRYIAFLVLQKRSVQHEDVYQFWNTFCEKLNSENSYQRSIGIMLLAENVKWDRVNQFDKVVKTYLSHCCDEKFITSRQTIQSINRWMCFKPHLKELVVNTLIKIDINKLKDTQRKLVLLDIIGVLAEVQKAEPDNRISDFLLKAMTGGLLDKKTIKQIEKVL